MACVHARHEACDIECAFCPALCACPCHASDERFLRAKQAAEQREQDALAEKIDARRKTIEEREGTLREPWPLIRDGRRVQLEEFVETIGPDLWRPR